MEAAAPDASEPESPQAARLSIAASAAATGTSAFLRIGIDSFWER